MNRRPDMSPAPEAGIISTPALKLALYDMGQHTDSGIAVVETGDEGEFLPAMLEEHLFLILRDLFQRRDTSGDEARRQDGDTFDVLAGQILDGLVGIGLKPLRGADA